MSRPEGLKRDELEAIVWQNFRPGRDAQADAAAVDAILAAADQYAQRGAYAAASVHFSVPCRQPGPAHQCARPPRACNSTCWIADIAETTGKVADVTCAKCKSSTPYLEALAAEIAAA